MSNKHYFATKIGQPAMSAVALHTVMQRVLLGAAVAAAVEWPLAQSELWTLMFHGIEVETSDSYLVEAVYASMMRGDKAEVDHGVVNTG
jgi:hypothetical protein